MDKTIKILIIAVAIAVVALTSIAVYATTKPSMPTPTEEYLFTAELVDVKPTYIQCYVVFDNGKIFEWSGNEISDLIIGKTYDVYLSLDSRTVKLAETP